MTKQTVYRADIVVIGAGIAGASVAYELAAEAHVIVVDMEDNPGYHSTGRSVAIFCEAYGPAPIIALTRCSRDFFDPAVPGFFWLAGQGGYGIQSAPALSQLAAALIAGKPPPAARAGFGFDVGAASPGRFRSP